MARKRLSNLNSEEAKKSPDPKSAATNPPPAPKQPAASAEKTNDEKDQEPTQLQPVKGEVTASVKKAESAKKTASVKKADPVEIVDPGEVTDPVKTATPVEVVDSIEVADLSVQPDSTHEALAATIAELNETKATLETVCQTARHRETEFRAQIEQLQTDLQEKQALAEQLQTDLQKKQALIEQLQTDLKQSSQLKAELEDARKMILQLSQVNAQPTPPDSSPSIQAAEPKLTSPTSKQGHLPQTQPLKSQPLQTQPSAQPQRPADRSLSPIALQRQPTAPARQNPFAISPQDKLPEKLPAQDSRLTDSDMGWVD